MVAHGCDEWLTTWFGLTLGRVFVTPIFPKKTKCKPICMPRSSFMHIVTYKWIQKRYHVRKTKIIRDLCLILETKALVDWGCVRLALAHLHNDFTAASSFQATLFIARVSTCRTQQVWGKNECKGFIVDWALSIQHFSWSTFISTWLLIKYKFIPTPVRHKDKIGHKHMANITREHDWSPSSSSINHVRVQAALDREHS
jgi:hypothetical protein